MFSFIQWKRTACKDETEEEEKKPELLGPKIEYRPQKEKDTESSNTEVINPMDFLFEPSYHIWSDCI